MKASYWELAILCCILVFALLVLSIIVRRYRSIRKVRHMPKRQQIEKINELAKPFGFFYECGQEIFTSRIDAWQREIGYRALFDRAAVFTGMIIDALPVYFDYAGKTWLIEFWKGQYGINVGAEIGIYHAQSLLAPDEYATTGFTAVKNCEMPVIRSRLFYFGGKKRRWKQLYDHQARHWWLTGFLLGKYIRPEKLVLQSAIEFQNTDMAAAFLFGAKKLQLPYFQAGREDNCVYTVFGHGEKIPCGKCILHRLALLWNQILVCLFLMITVPFQDPAERLLFLYYQFPWCFRRLLRLGRKYCG